MAGVLKSTCLFVDAECDDRVAVLIAHQHERLGSIDSEVSRSFPLGWLVSNIAEVACLLAHRVDDETVVATIATVDESSGWMNLDIRTVTSAVLARKLKGIVPSQSTGLIELTTVLIGLGFT